MKSKKIWIGSSVAAGLAGILFLASQEHSATAIRPPTPPRAEFELGIPTAQEVRSLVQGYGTRIESTESDLQSLKTHLSDLHQELKNLHSAQQDWFQKLQESSGPPPPPPPGPEFPRFRKFEFDSPRAESPTIHIPAGSFGECTLLSGVYAPVQAEGLPVLLRLDVALVGPNRSRIPIRDALLIGKAQGDANSQRAIIQLQTLSYVAPSGKTIEVPINGWVIDDDGIQGLKGTYVWRAEELAFLAATTGGLSAGADALTMRQTTSAISPLGSTSTLTGDPLAYAGSRAVSGALSKISDIVAQRMQEITPAVVVPNGKTLTIALITGASLPGIALKEMLDDATPRPFVGLDFNR